MSGLVTVYVGEWGTYVVPPEVVQKALELTPEAKLNDRRTKGARYINQWGRQHDAQNGIAEKRP